jgi:hypothetical protein
MEAIDLNFTDLEPISLNLSDDFGSSKPTSSSSFGNSGSSVNFGPGIELLMNDKKRNASNNINIDLGDLDKLENELNELSGSKKSGATSASSSSMFGDTKSISGLASSFFGFGGDSAETAGSKPSAKLVEEIEKTDSRLGHSTAESMGGTSRTWDGFTKMGDIPPGDMGGAGPSSRLSEKEKRRKKRMMIKKLEEWYEKGHIKSNSRYDMESPYEEVEDEFENAMEDKRKKDSIKLQGWWFMTFVNSVEYANSAFNPFDLNLDGWGEQVSEDIDSYEEIFSELHEKYKGGKLAPELSLLLRLGFSACMVNFTNKALSSATPGFNDVIKQSPELMKMFTDATVKNMSQQSPGFAFASNLVNNPDAINTSFGPPPKPVETKSNPPTARSSMVFTSNEPPQNRPDLSMGRGTMFKERGVDVTNNYVDVNKSEAPIRTPAPSGGPSSSYSASNFYAQPPPTPTPSGLRPEMRGPTTDIDNILSGLKTKAVNIHEQSTSSANLGMGASAEDDSMISISSLKDMQNGQMPKRSNRRKNTSNKNTISLDI